MVRRRMLCSRIHRTIPADGSPDVIQVSIDALLGLKDVFFCHKSLPVGYSSGVKKHVQGGKGQAGGKTGPGKAKHSRGDSSANRGKARVASTQKHEGPAGISVSQSCVDV
jgi:hypothetical protein